MTPSNLSFDYHSYNHSHSKNARCILWLTKYRGLARVIYLNNLRYEVNNHLDTIYMYEFSWDHHGTFLIPDITQYENKDPIYSVTSLLNWNSYHNYW
jgi:hypothetical protein